MISADMDVFRTITSRTKLFKKPHRIGDTVEVDKRIHLIIGIENFSVHGSTLTIRFTTQVLNHSDYPAMEAQGNPWRDNEVEVEIQHKYNDERVNDFTLGVTYPVERKGIKYMYKLLEYTDIEVVGTDIKISGIMRPLYPINPKEAKAKFRHERMKKLQLEVY